MKKRGQKYQQNILEQYTFSLAINVKVKVGFQIFQKIITIVSMASALAMFCLML